MSGEHEGHRKRMMRRLESGVLLPHEMLEVMLFPLLPRKNTNELAHRLIAHFGSIASVYSATIDELQRVPGVGENIAAHIRCTGLVYRSEILKEENQFTGKYETQRFLAYVKAMYQNVQCEVVDVYMLDRKGAIFKTERFTDRNTHTVEINPLDLSKLLLSHNPSGVVLVHNHPMGEAVASDSDDEMTKQCQLVCNMHGVLFCDHIIYAPSGVYSYYLSGKLQEISREYTVGNLSGNKEKEPF